MTESEQSGAPAEPGKPDISPGERRLARPPSDRYRAAEAAAAAAGSAATVDPAASVARGVAVATAIAIVGAAAIVYLGGVALGQLGLWRYGLAEGGVLGPLDYLGQVYGPLVLLEFAAAGVVAWLAAR